jgi:hypothetical protein
MIAVRVYVYVLMKRKCGRSGERERVDEGDGGKVVLDDK